MVFDSYDVLTTINSRTIFRSVNFDDGQGEQFRSEEQIRIKDWDYDAVREGNLKFFAEKDRNYAIIGHFEIKNPDITTEIKPLIPVKAGEFNSEGFNQVEINGKILPLLHSGERSQMMKLKIKSIAK